jgi:glycosyltransferase involved in cell wall biosynthesis
MPFEVRDILALIQHPDVPGDNWRLIRPCLRMRQAGINARYYWGDDDQEMPTDPDETVLIVRLLTGTDEATIDRWLAERRPKVRAIVYEFDDVLWSEAMVSHLERADFMQGKSREELLRQGELARYFASRCDGVIVSSEPLADAMRPYTDRPVIVVPNMLDVRWFRAQMAARAPWADHLTIGWAGGRRPEADLVPMAKAWGRIARRYPEVRFVVASSLVPDVIFREVDDLDRIIRLPWVSWNDYPVIYQTDIGCCAVEDTEFSRAKTPIKAWEYAIGGAAVVGTPMLYGECVSSGGAGLLAETADEWYDMLALLIENAGLRYTMNDRLYDHVEQQHGIDTQLHRWPAALAQIVEATVAVPV